MRAARFLRLSVAVTVAAVALAVVSCVLTEPYEVSPRVYDGLTCSEVTAELGALSADIAAADAAGHHKKRARLQAHYRALATVDALRQCYRRAPG